MGVVLGTAKWAISVPDNQNQHQHTGNTVALHIILVVIVCNINLAAGQQVTGYHSYGSA